MTEKQIKDRVNRMRQIRGKRSQRQAAIDIGTSSQNWQRYEQDSSPHLNFILLLAIKESISPDWLLLGRGSMKLKNKVQ